MKRENKLMSYEIGCGTKPFRPLYSTLFKFRAIKKARQLKKDGYSLVKIYRFGKDTHIDF